MKNKTFVFLHILSIPSRNPDLKDENCRDMNSFCSGYIALRYRYADFSFRNISINSLKEYERIIDSFKNLTIQLF